MRKIICTLIMAGMLLVLAACNNSEHRVKIKDDAAVLEDMGIKVTLPKGWVVFDTEESMNRNGTIIREFMEGYTKYTKFDYMAFVEADVVVDVNAMWGSRFLLYAERPGGGIALTLRTMELPEEVDIYCFARDVNNTVTELYKRGGFDVCGTLDPIQNGESTGISGYISEVNVKESERDGERIFVLTDYIFTYKNHMYCMEIYAEESAYDDGKNIQILPAEL